ncbi:MAG: alpha/beta hydrolase [Candidatus Dormibacterales bacterium]
MPPVLFVHGFWHGPWCWDEHVIPWFRARGYDARAVALRRHQSRHAPGLRTTRIREYVEDVAEAASKMAEPPVVVGHSMGGFITQKYLEDHVAPAAVLVASVPPSGILGAALRYGTRHPLRLAAANLTWSLYGVIGTPARARQMLFGPALPDEKVREYQAKLTDDSYFVYAGMLFERPDVARVRRTPLLVIGGELDATISPREVAAAARTYGSEPVMFPDGHDLMLEPSWEKMAERIHEFIQKTALRSSDKA